MEPGVYDLSDAEYRAADALSCSEARLVLDSPAKYRWRRDHGEVHADHFDFGKAAHKLVLGAGASVRVVDVDDWRTKEAKAEKAAAHEAGEIPVKRADWDVVRAMAAAIADHPLASALFRRTSGRPEVSLFWDDARSGAPLRARLDWLPDFTGRRLVIPEYKSTTNASPRAFAASAASFGYHQQHAWYVDGVSAALDCDVPAFVFVAQEKDPPYLVSVVELDAEAVAIGRDRNRRAIEVWLRCRRTGQWPGYPLEVQSASLPKWAAYQHDDDLAAWSDPHDF